MAYDSMTIEELEAELQVLTQAWHDKQAEMAECATALNKAVRAKNLSDQMGGVSAEDIAILTEMLAKNQSVAAAAVESAEEVGTPD